jgi:hypothetical protein
MAALFYLDKGTRHAHSDNGLRRRLAVYLVLSVLMLTVMLL